MANIKQQIKRDITNKKRNELNSSFDSSVKTAMKAFEACLEAGNPGYRFGCSPNGRKRWARRYPPALRCTAGHRRRGRPHPPEG